MSIGGRLRSVPFPLQVLVKPATLAMMKDIKLLMENVGATQAPPSSSSLLMDSGGA